MKSRARKRRLTSSCLRRNSADSVTIRTTKRGLGDVLGFRQQTPSHTHLIETQVPQCSDPADPEKHGRDAEIDPDQTPHFGHVAIAEPNQRHQDEDAAWR